MGRVEIRTIEKEERRIMFKYTPFFKVLDYIMDVELDFDLDFSDRLSIRQEFEGLILTYHRIYKGKDSGEILSFNLAHCDDEEIVDESSKDKSFAFNEMISKVDSADSREKFILFSIFKEKMIFVYTKIKSELKNKKNYKKDIQFIKGKINKNFEEFTEVVNLNYPNYFPKDWEQFEDAEEVSLMELREHQEESDAEPEQTIKMRFR